MFTLHHGFWLFFLTRKHAEWRQFVLGSMLPDYVYFLLAGLLLVNGRLDAGQLLTMTPTVFMSYLPLYPWAVQADLWGHSAVAWGLAYVAALLPIARNMQAFIVGWGSHLLIDGLTHGAYANYYLYPLSMLAVHSPVSYWEPQFFAAEFKTVNGILMALTASYLVGKWWRSRNKQGKDQDK